MSHPFGFSSVCRTLPRVHPNPAPKEADLRQEDLQRLTLKGDDSSGRALDSASNPINGSGKRFLSLAHESLAKGELLQRTKRLERAQGGP